MVCAEKLFRFFCFGLGFIRIDIGHQLVAGDGFFGQQIFGDLVQQGTVAGEGVDSLLVSTGQQSLDRCVDLGGSALGAVQIALSLQILA